MLTVAALCLVGASMRPALTAVGPLLESIAGDTGVSLATLGVLSAVPLLTWAVLSPAAPGLSRRLGLNGAVTASLLMLLAGVLVRSLPGATAWLWIGTLMIGIALAIMNVLMPTAVKRDFPTRIPALMGLYSAILGGSGALGSGVAVPVSMAFDGGDGWRISLAIVGGALVPVALTGWVLAARTARPAPISRPPGRRAGIWGDPVAWAVAAYMGVHSAAFYIVVTWLAPISSSGGRSPALAGVDVMAYQVFCVVGSLAVAFLLRGRSVRTVVIFQPLLGVVGTAGLLAGAGPMWFWISLLGLFSGSSLSIGLTLIAERGRDHHASSALSGMSQSVGYLVAAIGPIAFGALHSATGGWAASLVLLAAVILVQIPAGIAAARDRYVFG